MEDSGGRRELREVKEQTVEELGLRDSGVRQQTGGAVAEEGSTCVCAKGEVGDCGLGVRRRGEGVEGGLEGGRTRGGQSVDKDIGCEIGNPRNRRY